MPRQSTANPASDWGKYVARVLAKHGLNPRSQRIRTGIPHSTVDGWLRDIPASYPNAHKFAQKLDEDVNEAVTLAGFELMTPHSPEDSYDSAYAREMRRVREKLTKEGILELPTEMGHKGGTRELTPEDAVNEARDFEQMVRELHGKASGGH